MSKVGHKNQALANKCKKMIDLPHLKGNGLKFYENLLKLEGCSIHEVLDYASKISDVRKLVDQDLFALYSMVDTLISSDLGVKTQNMQKKPSAENAHHRQILTNLAHNLLLGVQNLETIQPDLFQINRRLQHHITVQNKHEQSLSLPEAQQRALAALEWDKLEEANKERIE